MIDFLKHAFDAEETSRHAHGPGGGGFVVDALYERALEAGAISILPPMDQPNGARLAIVQDPVGNRWLATKSN